MAGLEEEIKNLKASIGQYEAILNRVIAMESRISTMQGRLTRHGEALNDLKSKKAGSASE